jgi:nucleoid-associated protein YgaU
MVMKTKINREIKIGLSLLLVLVLILAGVVVRRLLTAAPIDLAQAEDKHGEGLHDKNLTKEAELFPKSAAVTPLGPFHRDDLHRPDDPNHRGTETKDQKKEAASAASGLIAANPPKYSTRPENMKPTLHAETHSTEPNRTEPNHTEPRITTYAPSGEPSAGREAMGAADSDDRYSVSAASADPRLRPGLPTPSEELPAEHPKRENGGSMVIQVSGEGGDGTPRTIDRYSPGPIPAQAGNRAGQGIPPAPIVNETLPADGRFARPAADPEAARRLEKERTERDNAGRPPARDFHETGARADLPAPRGYSDQPPAARESRNGYDPNWQQPSGNAGGGNVPNYARDPAYNSTPPTYAAAPGGYAESRPSEGRDGLAAMRPQNPLRNDGTYEVQPNDSFWTISQRVYGSGAYFRALAEQNRGKAARPDRLPPGLVIATPPVSQLEKDYPDLCPRPNHRDAVRDRAAGVGLAATAGGGRTYVVQEGDTLSSIARNELGKVSRWAEIYQLNREALGKDYDYLAPGMRLVLPIRDSQSGDRTTRRDEGGTPFLR